MWTGKVKEGVREAENRANRKVGGESEELPRCKSAEFTRRCTAGGNRQRSNNCSFTAQFTSRAFKPHKRWFRKTRPVRERVKRWSMRALRLIGVVMRPRLKLCPLLHHLWAQALQKSSLSTSSAAGRVCFSCSAVVTCVRTHDEYMCAMWPTHVEES